MSSGQNLTEQLASIQKDGFSEEFVIACAKTFEQHSFPEVILPTARLYLFYLSTVIGIIVSGSSEWKTLIGIGLNEDSEITQENIPERARRLVLQSQTASSAGNIALALGSLSYLYAQKNKKSGEEFLTLFVNSWVLYWALC